MRRLIKSSLVVGALAVVIVAASASTAQAQVIVGRGFNARFPTGTVSGRAFPTVQNAYPSFVPTQLQRDAFRQWNRDVRFVGRTYATLPPWLFGYNPYPPINYGPVYQYPAYPPYVPPYAPPFVPPFVPAYDGYTNPYAAPLTGGYVNPYGVR
jgi:hypothetical protein